ncbi:CAP domain-containing protein [Caldimonas tepidiphila]|uniref:CAP domain-containing protein n=1 Tax=Caldimonas tepidiphila TaxID=2315841 RepID=UPI00196B4130|nr:CvpA family protein [Caldimonas tepidiphila]
MDISANLVDILLGLVILLGLWAGWRHGFLSAASGLLTLFASLVLAFAGYRPLAGLIERHVVALGVWGPPLAFVLALVLARLLVGSLMQRALDALPRAAHVHRANRVLGLAPGLVNGLINATILALLLLALPLFDGLSARARDSVLAGRLAVPAEWLEAKLATVFEEAAGAALDTLTVRTGPRDTVKLPFTVPDPRVREDLEARMLEMLNEERRAQGLQPLKADPELAEVARAHSRDMFARGYFSHVTPDGRDPFDRLRASKVRFLTAGENLALARTLPTAHQGLMDSPGHRANILRPAFGRVGIGVLDGGRHGLMVTQKFRN